MKKNLIYLFTTLLLMCVCENGYAQELDNLDTSCLECWQEALQKMEKKYGSVSEEMAKNYRLAGETFCNEFGPYNNGHDFGISCYEKALAIDKKLYGKKSAMVGFDYIQMAVAYGWFLENAKLYVDSALVILRPQYGEQSHEVAMAYLALASSYYQQNDDICRVAAQCMINTGREYYYVCDYEEIISNLEKSIEYYKKASNIYSKLDDKYKYKIDLIANCINQNEEEIMFYKKELELAEKQEE